VLRLNGNFRCIIHCNDENRDLIMELESKVKNSKINYKASNGSRYREIIEKFISNPPKTLSIGGLDEKGDMTFSICMKDIGLAYKDYRNYENEFFSRFIIDFIGELIVRENLNEFVNNMNGYGVEEYTSVVEAYGSHKQFGITAQKGQLIFKFHVSFIKHILTEDLREIL
jgi:hypothetical protein